MTKKKTPKRVKTDFVRGLPVDISAEDALEKAKAAGITMSRAHYYNIKSTLKAGSVRRKAAKSVKPLRAAARRQNPALELQLSSKDKRVAALIELVRAVGLQRVRSVLNAIEKIEAFEHDVA